MIRSILGIVAYPSTPDIRCYETLYQISSIHGILQVWLLILLLLPDMAW